jgi:hypothetical protein
VINVFQLNFEARLVSWYDLRKSLEDADIKTKCLEIDKWWQSAPQINHYLHPHEIDDWPSPWELINDNSYCAVARGLGMVYTLLVLGVEDVDFCIATDDNSEDCVLVLVDHAKYVLNYYPDSVLNINLQEFNIKSRLDINKIKNKIE